MSTLHRILTIALFNLRSLPERKGAALTAAVGIAGVVGVLVGVLAIAEGFRRAMTVSGSPEVAIVLRSGADSEMTSGLDRDAVRTIGDVLARLTEPALRPLRRILPDFGPVDLSPIALWLIILFVQMVVENLLHVVMTL